MNLKNILTFLRAAELGSFTKAAQELGYTQSTVTIQIKQLENELGILLFDRIGRKISLTPTGEEFISYANEIMRITLHAKAIGVKPETLRGTLRLGIIESLFIWRFSDLVPQFHRALPLISIEARSATSAELYHMLRQNDVDIAYILDKKISKKDCIKSCIKSEKIVFITSPDYPIAVQEDISLSEIVKHPLILAERIAIYRRELDEAAARQGIEFMPLLEINNLEVILKLLKKGMGISFLPEYVVRESVYKGELVILNVIDCEASLWSQIIYHKNKWVTPQMNLVMQLIQENVQGIEADPFVKTQNHCSLGVLT